MPKLNTKSKSPQPIDAIAKTNVPPNIFLGMHKPKNAKIETGTHGPSWLLLAISDQVSIFATAKISTKTFFITNLSFL